MKRLAAIHRYLNRRQYWLLAGLAATVAGIRLLLTLAALMPPGARFVYPLRRLEWDYAWIARWPVAAVLALGIVMLLPVGISWAIARADDGSRIDPGSATYELRSVVALIAIAGAAYLIVRTPFSTPREIDRAATATHRYILIQHGHEYPEYRFYLYECDTDGTLCQTLADRAASLGEGWIEPLELAGGAASVRVTHLGRTVFVWPPAE